MSPGSVLIGLALVIAVVPFVANPILKRSRRGHPKDSVGEQERNLPALLAGLRDLDFDHRTGKVSDEDHASLRAELLREAADAMQAPPSSPVNAERELEDAVLRLRHRSSQHVCVQCGNRLQPGDRYCSRCGHEADVICPRCRVPASPGDQYCPGCGTALGMEV